MIRLLINGQPVEVKEGTTVLEAARLLGIDVPTLCYDDRLTAHGACRICVVEVEKARTLMASCSLPASESMVVYTESERVIEARKEILELMIANHPLDCLTCEKTGDCRLQDYCYRYSITRGRYTGARKNYKVDSSNEFYESNQDKCILCGKCVRVYT